MVSAKKTRFGFSFLLLMVLCFFCLPLKEPAAQVYPLPISELEQAVSRWFHEAGFQTARVSADPASIRLRAVKGEKTCFILLQPQSPLASAVELSCLENSTPDISFQKQLSEYIDKFVSGTTADPKKETNAGQPEIPVEVLAKIETVVCVRAQRKDREVQFSGFLVDQEGLILSTAHDIEDVVTITVVCHDGRQIPGSLIKVDLVRDLALIDVQGPFSNFVSVADSRNLLGIGETIYSVGCPINMGGTVYSGMVNGPPRLVDGMPLWQVNMEIHHGSSGSPVFDGNGNLVAIIKGRLRGTESIGFLIPIETVVEFASHIPEK